MAMATVRIQCSKSPCNEDKGTCTCNGCSQAFCLTHYTEHQEILKELFTRIQDNYNLFRQTVNDIRNNPTLESRSIQEINQWQVDSIEKINQIAENCKQKLNKYRSKSIIDIENQLNTIYEQNRNEKVIDEIVLNIMKEKLNELQEKLQQTSEVLIKQESTSFIKEISVIVPIDDIVLTDNIIPIAEDTKWKQTAITVAGGNGKGNHSNQLSEPHCIFVDDDQTIFVADYGNNRIVEWKCNATNGEIVAGGNGKGNQMNQFNGSSDVIIDKESNAFIIADWKNRRVMKWSRENNTINGEIIIEDIDCWGLAMDKNGSLYTCDTHKNEVKQWKKGEKNGILVAGGNGKGDQLNQLHWPTSIFVDDNYSLYIADCYNHRVMKWVKDAREGIIVAGGNGQESSLKQLNKPEGVTVDRLGRIYVADKYNHRVMCWCDGAEEGTIVVGKNGKGSQPNQLIGPTNLYFDRQGNLYVVDYFNNRIQKFEIDNTE